MLVDPTGLLDDEWQHTMKDGKTVDLKKVGDKGGSETQYIHTTYEFSDDQKLDLGTSVYQTHNEEGNVRIAATEGDGYYKSPKWWAQASGKVDNVHPEEFLLSLGVTGLVKNGLRKAGVGLVDDAAKSSAKGFTYTKTAAKHFDDIVTKGANKGQLARPYMNSPLTIKEIMATGKGIPDATAKGALNFRVPGTFRGSQGTWELVVDPNKNLIYHFNFVK